MNENDLIVFEDRIDDAVVATACGPETLERTDEGLAEPLRVGCDRPKDGFQCGMSHILGKLVEMMETLGSDLDLVHAVA